MAIQTNAEEFRQLFPEVDLIQEAALRQGVIDIWMEVPLEGRSNPEKRLKR